MATEATINVRFPGEAKEAKRRGDAVLAREGISASHAVRSLYRHLDETQTVPAWMRPQENDVYEQRRTLMRSLAGVVSVPGDFDARNIKAERLARVEL